MQEVALLGAGMHAWGKFPEKTLGDLTRFAVSAALDDAGVTWREIQAVSAASSRFSGGKGWGLNGNDVVEDMGPTGVPVYNLSAGCAAGGNAFNIGYTLVASGMYDVVLVVGSEKLPKGFIQTSNVEDEADLEYMRQLAVGMPGPAFWGFLTTRRMHEYGTTEAQLAKIAVKAHQIAKHNERARFRQEFTLEDVLNSAMVSYPLRLYEICPVSDGAAAVVLCSAEVARAHTTSPVWVAASAIATALHNDGIPKGLGTVVPPGVTHHSEAAAAVKQAMGQSGITKDDLSLVELQDNTVYYELAFPEEWGLCEPGEAESLVEKGETMPDGRLPINPSGGFLCFGEATTAQGLFQICEMTYQLRGESGARQVPNARVALAQTLGLGGNASATVLKR